MKIRHNISILALASALSLSSCSNFLSVDVTESVSDRDFYQNQVQMEQAMVGLYQTLLVLPKYRFQMSEQRSDNVWVEYNSTGGNYQIAYFLNSELISNSTVLSTWTDLSLTIATANAILDHIDNVAFSQEIYKDEYRAEARFIRALAYFDLVRYFGNVPIATTSLNDDKSFQVGLSPAKEVYEQVIVPDLQYAAEHLLDTPAKYDGDEASATGRASKLAAKALLGEVYLTMAGFPVKDESKKELAKSLFKEVIDATYGQGKNWATDMAEWNKMWIHENDNKYFLFEIQYATDNDMSEGNWVTPLSVDAWHGTYYGGNKGQLSASSYMYGYVEPVLRNHFLEKGENGEYLDKRCEGTITVKNAKGQAIDPTSTNVFYFSKFWEHKVKREAAGYTDMSASLNANIYTWPQNFPIERIENIMLYYAELVGKTEGLPYLNAIHTRAGLTAYTDQDFESEEDYQQAVADERRYELAEEGFRWFDLVRRNEWQTALKTMFQDDSDGVDNDALAGYSLNVLPYTYIYPIPLTQVNLREGLYNQNPGYEQ